MAKLCWSLALDPKTVKRVDELRKRTGLSRSAQVEMLLRWALDELERNRGYIYVEPSRAGP